ncbi:MAG: hypothetical protein ACE3L7_22970 [Candidatus Pristimantibacillus sp.]
MEYLFLTPLSCSEPYALICVIYPTRIAFRPIPTGPAVQEIYLPLQPRNPFEPKVQLIGGGVVVSDW